MPSLRRFHPAVETIESRALPSAALAGTLSGTFTTPASDPDVGQSTQLSGQGTITPLGLVNAVGVVEGVGFIAHGHATGAISLSGTDGSVTLELSGPAQREGAKLPVSFHYTVASETGTYPTVPTAGNVQLTFHAAKGPKAAGAGQMTPNFIIAPSFTVRLSHAKGSSGSGW